MSLKTKQNKETSFPISVECLLLVTLGFPIYGSGDKCKLVWWSQQLYVAGEGILQLNYQYYS